MLLIRLGCLLLVLACAACAPGSGQTAETIGCKPGGLNADANPCNPANAKVGAASTVPVDSFR